MVKLLTGGSFLVLAQLVASPAASQVAGQAGPQGAAAEDRGELSEIVVTAERRATNIQKTAIPITAITGEELARQAKTQLDTVLRDVPSVQVQSAPTGGDIVIRGVGGNEVGGIAQDPAVALMQDGVYNGRASATVSGLYDIARVEVLRGPQGTLYGRNASGGAVNASLNF